MLAELVRKNSKLSLDELNQVCMQVAQTLYSEEFTMEDITEFQNNVIQKTQERMFQMEEKDENLRNLPEETKALYFLGLLVEMVMYLGIDIGIDYFAVKLDKKLDTLLGTTEVKQ